MRPDRRSSEFFELDVCHVPICLLEHLPLLLQRTLIMFGRHSSNELIKDLSLILFIGDLELGLLAPIRILCLLDCLTPLAVSATFKCHGRRDVVLDVTNI